ncbi:hypothetical protein A3844_07770 [Paenibacillus helianthi]|uniref:Glycosyltransferase family 1 protein n=1 Tax=Paenibacillus helianthi TaxID=1349432 RepID=A0ABX3ERE9_9BACL|nr:glycosyltransferase family 1 protein [Paenibacillus helianthi]OKP88581.1 hypothetical protein A3844_07770 [Paenibacillus helianthi]
MISENLIKPRRVLHIFGAMNRGGAETLIMNLYRELDKTKVQFDFGVHTNSRGDYDNEIEKLGGRIIHLPEPKKVGILKYKRVLKNHLINYGSFVAIHSHVHHFSGVVLKVAKKVKIEVRIAHSHNTNDAQKDSILRNAYRMTLETLIKKNSTHLLGCSKDACESLFGKKCWGKYNVEVIRNGLDFNLFKELDKEKSNIRNELNIPEDAFLVGHVGRFSEQKNHRWLIRIFKELIKKVPNAHLLLVGDGDLKQEIYELSENLELLGNVHFLGIREDIPRLMNSFNVFLFPSLFEGLGNVLIEAQAAGTPCVCSNTVPSEADINIGLMKFVGLFENENKWVSEILEYMDVRKYRTEELFDAITKSGYEIKQITRRMVEIYD